MVRSLAVCLLALATTLAYDRDACYQCDCPEQVKSHVCGQNIATNKLRGFRNMCVFECVKHCFKSEFRLLGPGRCGKYGEMLFPAPKD